MSLATSATSSSNNSTSNPIRSSSCIHHRRSESLNKHVHLQMAADEASTSSSLDGCYYEEDQQVLAIEQTIHYMDSMYDASFGSWIRDPRNLPQALPHLLKIAQEYPWMAIVPVLNYLTLDWPLSDTLHLLQTLVHIYPQHYGALMGRFLCSLPYEVQVHVLRGLQCQEYFSPAAWKQFLAEGWDFGTAAILFSALFECSHARQLLRQIFTSS